MTEVDADAEGDATVDVDAVVEVPDVEPDPSVTDVHAAELVAAVGLDDPAYDREAIQALTHLDSEVTRRWWRAMGIVELPDGEVALGEDDLHMVERIRDLILTEPANEQHVLRLARLLGGSFSRIADAQVAVLDDTLAGTAPLETAADRLAALRSQEGRELLELFESSVLYVWRRHLLATLGRWVGTGEDHTTQTVGFADISGFSTLSKSVDEAALATVVESFETDAIDVVSAHDGRVVKFIGDEVMYVVGDLPTAVDVALELGERMARLEPPVTLHCGIAEGPTVTIGGDVFGTTVNLASRLAKVARKGTVVVTREAARTLEGRDDLHLSRVRRVFELKGVGRTQLVSVSRRAVPDAAPDESGDRI